MKSFKEQHETRFLIEGAKFYPQTLVAISEFYRLVQDTWRETVSKSLPKLASAMGEKLSPQMIKPYADPADIGKGGTWFGLGVKITKKSSWTQLYYLEWSSPPEEQASFTAAACIGFGNTESASRAFDALEKHQRTKYPISRNKNEIYIWQPISSERDAIPEVLEEVSREWIRLWREAGGLPTFLAPRAKR
jgi:hypothetical protein